MYTAESQKHRSKRINIKEESRVSDGYPALIIMNANTSEPYNVNPRPVNNTYCIMTTKHMLELRRKGYQKVLTGFERRVEGLTNKYYDSMDVPADVRDEITRLNSDIDEYTKIINDIDNAIAVITADIPVLSAA